MEKEMLPGTKIEEATENVTAKGTPAKRGRGRPKKHKDAVARAKAWKEKQRQEGRRLDLFISPSVSSRIRKLSKIWGVTMAATVERLLMEACEKYPDQLFEDSERDTILVQKLLEKTNHMEGKT